MKKLTTEEFIRKSRQIHGDKYNYSKTHYISSKEKVTITCPIHGDFELKASNHISKHYGCPRCGIDNRARSRLLSLIEFVSRANIIHGNKYDYSKVTFLNMHEKVCIICPYHGEFYQTPQKHVLREQGCPKCNQSKGEREIEVFLKNNHISYISQYEIAISNLVNCSGKAYIDFYIPELNTAIEYNGILHYEYTPVFHPGGILDLKHLKDRDLAIIDYCNTNNIRLILIKYTDNILESLKVCRLEI